MDKLKKLLNAYLGVCELVCKVIPKTDCLSPSNRALLEAVLTWVIIPIFVFSLAMTFLGALKWAIFTGAILLLLLPALYIWSQGKNKEED